MIKTSAEGTTHHSVGREPYAIITLRDVTLHSKHPTRLCRRHETPQPRVRALGVKYQRFMNILEK